MRLDMSRGAFRAAVFLFVFSLVLAAANVLFTARQVNATRAATASTMQLCLAGNTARAQQVVLWDHIITISRPPPHQTPAQERARLATIRAFEAYVHHVFAPRNCHALTH